MNWVDLLVLGLAALRRGVGRPAGHGRRAARVRRRARRPRSLGTQIAPLLVVAVRQRRDQGRLRGRHRGAARRARRDPGRLRRPDDQVAGQRHAVARRGQRAGRDRAGRGRVRGGVDDRAAADLRRRPAVAGQGAQPVGDPRRRSTTPCRRPPATCPRDLQKLFDVSGFPAAMDPFNRTPLKEVGPPNPALQPRTRSCRSCGRAC